MTSADLVRQACKDRGVPLGRVEKALGFSNAYLKKTKGDLPILRVQAIAQYLDIPTEQLLPDGSFEKRIIFGAGDSIDKAVDDVKKERQRIESYKIQITEADLKRIVTDAIKESSIRCEDPNIDDAVRSLTENPSLMKIVNACKNADEGKLKRLLTYAELLMKGEL